MVGSPVTFLCGLVLKPGTPSWTSSRLYHPLLELSGQLAPVVSPLVFAHWSKSSMVKVGIDVAFAARVVAATFLKFGKY